MTPDEKLLNQAHEIIHGMEWILNGVHGHLQVEKRNGLTEIDHIPSKKGMKSEEYQKHRKILRDDYTSTITADADELELIFERVSQIIAKTA